jgi:preprotein translocase subunit SecG
MQTVIIVVHLFIVLALIGVVLLQRSEGGLGLGGGGGGGGGFMTGRGQANALTRATAILAALFFLTSVSLAWISSHARGPRSIFDGNAPISAPAGDTAPGAPAGGNVLDQLRQMQGGGGQGGAPAPAPEPAAPQVPQSR